MKRSTVTSKFQATIPQEIRKILDIQSGDKILFEILPDNQVVIRKEKRFDRMYAESLQATLEEWNSQNDDEDYRDL
ncbi:type II toxin-antitoxin system PrlF family antitoxin [Candidatus Dependentiae bacterium]|jgi:antitoxin PrlF|nr:type II toxin-antitoxin system PrlF family antitoxin [Candidatus Dependentiae bacterium]